MMKFSFENATTAQAFRISPNDTNYFVLLFDKEKDDIDNIFVVEIFTEGGAKRTAMARLSRSAAVTPCCCGPAANMSSRIPGPASFTRLR
jgi:hypothetical protein